jgi:protein subunit release factor A
MAQNPGYRVINFLEKAMKRVIEIRAAEGGEDSKLFTVDLAQAYQRHFDRVG